MPSDILGCGGLDLLPRGYGIRPSCGKQGAPATETLLKPAWPSFCQLRAAASRAFLAAPSPRPLDPVEVASPPRVIVE